MEHSDDTPTTPRASRPVSALSSFSLGSSSEPLATPPLPSNSNAGHFPFPPMHGDAGPSPEPSTRSSIDSLNSGSTWFTDRGHHTAEPGKVERVERLVATTGKQQAWPKVKDLIRNMESKKEAPTPPTPTAPSPPRKSVASLQSLLTPSRATPIALSTPSSPPRPTRTSSTSSATPLSPTAASPKSYSLSTASRSASISGKKDSSNRPWLGTRVNSAAAAAAAAAAVGTPPASPSPASAVASTAPSSPPLPPTLTTRSPSVAEMSRRFERPLSAASTSAASPVASTLETKSNLRRLSATFEKAAQKPAVMTKKAAGKDIVRSATLPAKVEVKLAEVQSKPKPVAIGGPRPEPIVAPLPELTASPELMPESKVASTLPPEELKTEPISPPEEPKLAFLDDSPATSFLKSLVQPVLNTGVSGGNGGVAMDRTVRRVRSGEDFEGSRADVATAVDGEIASVVAAVEKLVTQERAVEEPVAGVESHVEVLLTTMDEQTPAVVPKTVLPAREEKATVAPVEAVSEITTDPVPSVTSNVKLSVAETAVKVLTVSPVCPAVTEAMEYTTTFDADAIHPSPSPSTSSLHQSLRITQSTRLPSSASHPILHLVFLQLDPSSPGATSVSLRLLFHVRDMDPRRALAVLASDDGWVSSRWSRAGVTLGRVEGRSGWVAYECVVEGVREGVTEFVGRLDMGGQEHWDRGVGGAGHCVRVEWVEAGREVDEEVIVREVGKSWREARQITPLSNDSEDEVDEPLSRQQWRPRPDQAPRLSSPPYRDCASTSPRMDPIPEVEEPVAALWADEIEAMDESVRDATFAVGDGETWDAQMRAVEMCIGVATDAVGMLERELAALFSSSANEADVWVARIDAVIVAPGMGIKAIEAALCVASSAVMFLERECATEKNGAVVELGDGGVEDVERTLSLVASIIEDVERVVAKHVDSGHGSPLPEEMGPVQDGAEGLDVHEMASEIVSIVSSILVGFEETVTTAGPATASSA